jgi:hypothetical protein
MQYITYNNSFIYKSNMRQWQAVCYTQKAIFRLKVQIYQGLVKLES